MTEPRTPTEARPGSWAGDLATAVGTGLVTTYLPVQRWRRSARWALHGGLGALTAGAAGVHLAVRSRHVDAEQTDEPASRMGAGASVAVALGLGTLVTATSRGGQSADEWVERTLVARGVRRPRVWMGLVAAGASLAMSAVDVRRAARDRTVSRDMTGRS